MASRSVLLAEIARAYRFAMLTEQIPPAAKPSKLVAVFITFDYAANVRAEVDGNSLTQPSLLRLVNIC